MISPPNFIKAAAQVPEISLGYYQEIASRMISKAVAKSDDVKFHNEVYGCLLDENRLH
jgi:hypothetical protein